MAKKVNESKVTRKLQVKVFNKLKKYFTSIAQKNTEEHESVILLNSTGNGSRTVPIEWKVVEFKHDYKGNTQKGLYLDAFHKTESVKGEKLEKYYREIKNALRIAVYNAIKKNNGFMCGFYGAFDDPCMWVPNDTNDRCHRQMAYEISQNADTYIDDDYIKSLRDTLANYVELLNEEFSVINEFMVLDLEHKKDEFNEYKKTLTPDKQNQRYKYEISLDEFKLLRNFYIDYLATNRTDIQAQTEKANEKNEPIKVKTKVKTTKATL